MKREMTPQATIWTALFLAIGLVLIVTGIGAVVSPWFLDGGFVGWLLDFKPSQPGQLIRNPVGMVIEALPAIFSFIVGIWLLGFGLPCGAGGLALWLSHPGTKSPVRRAQASRGRAVW